MLIKFTMWDSRLLKLPCNDFPFLGGADGMIRRCLLLLNKAVNVYVPPKRWAAFLQRGGEHVIVFVEEINYFIWKSCLLAFTLCSLEIQNMSLQMDGLRRLAVSNSIKVVKTCPRAWINCFWGKI